MSSLQPAIPAFSRSFSDPGSNAYEPDDPGFLISILRGLRNGLYYGGKIRLMHGLVMLLLFRKGTWTEGMKGVLKATWEHASNLGLYVMFYKALVRILEKIRGRKSKYHALLAGFLIGGIVFRKKTSVNLQISLYLLARVIVGGAANIAQRYKIKVDAYPKLTAACWAIVMFLYADDPSSLQASLKSSMDFLYTESESYKSWTDFVPLEYPSVLSNDK